MVGLLARPKYYGVISLVHIDIPIHMSKAGSWLRTVFLPRLSRTATFPGYFQIAGTRIPVRREHGGHGPHSLGGGLARLLGIRRRAAGESRSATRTRLRHVDRNIDVHKEYNTVILRTGKEMDHDKLRASRSSGRHELGEEQPRKPEGPNRRGRLRPDAEL